MGNALRRAQPALPALAGMAVMVNKVNFPAFEHAKFSTFALKP